MDLTLAEANRLTARLGGYMGRRHDGDPGAESLGIGLRRLMDLTRGWRLRKQYDELPNKGYSKCV
jgi:Transposase Tn5 dimerisation domain